VAVASADAAFSTIAAPLVAVPSLQHSELEAHDTPFKEAVPSGTVGAVQVVPPSLVASMIPLPSEPMPDASQSVVVGHDTLKRYPSPLGRV
jgi:hypothetical protein